MTHATQGIISRSTEFSTNQTAFSVPTQSNKHGIANVPSTLTSMQHAGSAPAASTSSTNVATSAGHANPIIPAPYVSPAQDQVTKWGSDSLAQFEGLAELVERIINNDPNVTWEFIRECHLLCDPTLQDQIKHAMYLQNNKNSEKKGLGWGDYAINQLGMQPKYQDLYRDAIAAINLRISTNSSPSKTSSNPLAGGTIPQAAPVVNPTVDAIPVPTSQLGSDDKDIDDSRYYVDSNHAGVINLLQKTPLDQSSKSPAITSLYYTLVPKDVTGVQVIAAINDHFDQALLSELQGAIWEANNKNDEGHLDFGRIILEEANYWRNINLIKRAIVILGAKYGLALKPIDITK